MTSEQTAAFVNAQVALLNAEIEVMKQENASRERRGESPAWNGEMFQQVLDRYLPFLEASSVRHFFLYGGSHQ